MINFSQWSILQNVDENTHLSAITEAVTSTRYSIEVNFRSKKNEVLSNFAKIVLGYVSAALKQNNFHVKHVYEEPPIRIIVSTRAFDDGEWNLIISYNPEHGFILSKGFYNKDRKSVSISRSEKAIGDSAADITQQARNLMHELQNTPDKHLEKLKPVPLKRGPKR